MLCVCFNFTKRGMIQEETIRDLLDRIEAYVRGEGVAGWDEKESYELMDSADLLDKMSVDPAVVAFCSPGLLEDMNLVSAKLRRMANKSE